jgi:hypothetical protein
MESLLHLAAAALALFLAGLGAQSDRRGALAPDDQAFLQQLERRALLYFVEHTDPITGLTRDRAPADGGPSTAYASVAASGFALSGWCIAAENGWMSPEDARERCLRTLRSFSGSVEHVRGWFYHFVRAEDGTRAWKCEASTIDTALFLQGALTAREYFGDPEITRLVNALYGRIDWRWALDGGTTLSHGWRPETGFIKYRWDHYAEMLGLYLLGIGAASDPLPPSTWDAWSRGPVTEYAGRSFIQCPPLFTHQFSHAWFSFRNLRDGYADYWRNSVDATLAQRQWCADQSGRFPQWSLKLWGLTSSDSRAGYVSWGGPEKGPGRADGTVVPCAPAGSLPFAPEECLATLRHMRSLDGTPVWGRYGFVDSFNPHTGWIASDVIAIDQGITLLMAENLRSGFVWRQFMRAPEVRRALRLAGFQEPPETPAAGLLFAAASGN